jgi:hypothetical protein
MRRHLATTAVLAGLVGGTLVGTTGVATADTCNAYSSTCPSPSVSGLHFSRNPGNAPAPAVEGNNASLPFTGGEIALMVIAGVGAIGAGTVFVATGRRRRSAAH